MPFVKGVKFDYSKRKPKAKTIDTAITFRTTKQEKDDFILTCSALGMWNGKVLRDLIRKFIEVHKDDEKVKKFLESQKVQEVSE